MLQESVSNVISLLPLFSEKDRSTSAFLFMTVSSKFYTFYLIDSLSQYFFSPELRRKWKASKEERVSAESPLRYQASQQRMSFTKCPTICGNKFTLHANTTPALLHSHSASFAPLRWCEALTSLCPSLPSLEKLFPTRVSQSRMHKHENYTKIASSRCDCRRLWEQQEGYNQLSSNQKASHRRWHFADSCPNTLSPHSTKKRDMACRNVQSRIIIWIYTAGTQPARRKLRTVGLSMCQDPECNLCSDPAHTS